MDWILKIVFIAVGYIVLNWAIRKFGVFDFEILNELEKSPNLSPRQKLFLKSIKKIQFGFVGMFISSLFLGFVFIASLQVDLEKGKSSDITITAMLLTIITGFLAYSFHGLMKFFNQFLKED